jgi:SAM-dependent methyltransferase
VAADWLATCGTVLDLGCGRAYFQRFLRPGQSYVGVDGSSEHAAIRCDLEDCAVRAEGVLLRHVLEHNLRWKPILRHALSLFTVRMALVLFVPPELETRIVSVQDVGGVRVPDIAISHSELRELIEPFVLSHAVYDTASQYAEEHVYLLER